VVVEEDEAVVVEEAEVVDREAYELLLRHHPVRIMSLCV